MHKKFSGRYRVVTFICLDNVASFLRRNRSAANVQCLSPETDTSTRSLALRMREPLPRDIVKLRPRERARERGLRDSRRARLTFPYLFVTHSPRRAPLRFLSSLPESFSFPCRFLCHEDALLCAREDSPGASSAILSATKVEFLVSRRCTRSEAGVGVGAAPVSLSLSL